MNVEHGRKRPSRMGIFAATLVFAPAMALAQAGSDEAVSVALEISDSVCLDPWQNTNTAPLNMLRPIMETLTRIDPDTGKLQPWLAKSWEINDRATEFTFTIRSGVKFSDGTPLTAEVVRDNWIALAKKVGPLALRPWPFFSTMVSAEVLDGNRVKLTLKEPNAGFINSTASIFQSITAPASVLLSPEERCSKGVLGTGAFAVQSYQPGQQMTLAARSDYNWAPDWAGHKGPAYLKTVTFYAVPESNSRLGMLTSGQADVVQALPSQGVATAKDANYSIVTRSLPGMPLRLIANTQRGPLAEQPVRRAISLGINREEIKAAVFNDLGKIATSDLVAGVPGYADQSSLLAYDPEKAGKLLDEAGWIKGNDGLRHRDNKTLTVSATFLNVLAENQPTLELIQQQMLALGVDLKLVGPITSAQNLELNKTKNYDLIYLNSTDIDADIMRSSLSTKMVNRSMLDEKSPIEAMLQDQKNASDPGNRAAILKSLQARAIEEAYDVPIMEQTQIFGASPAISGLTLDIEARMMFYDARKASN